MAVKGKRCLLSDLLYFLLFAFFCATISCLGLTRFALAKGQFKNNPSSSNELVTNKSTVSDVCKSSKGYFSIEELYEFCHLPAPCGTKTQCEGKIAKVKGYIDHSNVFDRKNYPLLPYEKFTIYDKKGKSLEIWAVSNDNDKIFTKIYHEKAFPNKTVFICGKIIGYDMPIMGDCHRGIKINLEATDGISFCEGCH